MTANAIKAIAPYLISGNKGDLLGRHGSFYLDLVQPATVVLDAFGGAAIYTHFLAQQGALPAGSTWNEWEYSRSITNRQIKDAPAAVVREILSLRQEFDAAFPTTETQPTREDTLRLRARMFDWVNQRLMTAFPSPSRDAMGRFVLPDTPQTAALYLFLQNHMAENRVVDFDLNAAGQPRLFTGGKPIGKDDLRFVNWDNTSNSMEHVRGSRIWGEGMPALIRDASRRFTEATIRQGDGWQLAAEAPAGALFFVDTSYFPTDEQTAAGAAVMNYGNTTLGDANPALWFQKFEKYLLPKGQDVRYVITNNFNGRVVDQLEQAGWTVLRTFRGSAAAPSHEFIALSPAAAADVRLPAAPARRYGPGGIPTNRGPGQGAAGGTAPDQLGLPAGEPRQAGVRNSESVLRRRDGLNTPALDRTLEPAPGQATDAVESARAAWELDEASRAAADFQRSVMDAPEIELMDLEAEMREQADLDNLDEEGNTLPAANRIHPATGHILAASKRQPKPFPNLVKPILPAPKALPELFGEWVADLGYGQNWRMSDQPADLVGFRGEITADRQNGFGNTEGNGIYLMRKPEEAAVFGRVRRVKFPEPQRPFLVNEDLYLLLESEELDQPIDPAKDSPWLQASKYASQHATNLLKGGQWNRHQELTGDILTKLLMDAGYDSVYVQGMPDDWVVLLRETRPGQKPLKALPAANRTVVHVEPGFYSTLAEAVRAKMPARATPAQILGLLKNAGLKTEEIKWTGIKNWLEAQAQDGPITQDQVLAYLAPKAA